MSQKVLDVFFRHKFLIILPLVILTLVGAAASWSRQTTEYSASARVWAQRTPLLTSSLGRAGGGTTATQQANVLNDLLKLDSFRLSVASNVDGLAGLSPGQQAAAIREGTSVSASGRRVLIIRHVDEDPARAQAIVQAIIDTYSATVATEVVAQSDLAQAFYEERLEAARVRLEESTGALGSSPETTLLEAESDPELEALTTEVEVADADYNAILDRLESIYLQRDAALKGRDLSFRLMDPPKLPSTPLAPSTKDLLMFPLLGLLMGISASGVVLFALTRLDDSIRLPGEARKVGAPVLAVVPELGRRRMSSWPQNFVRLVVAASRGLIGNLI